MHKASILILSCLIGLLSVSCTQPQPLEITPGSTDNGLDGPGLVTAIGKPVGAPVVQTLGPAGGSLTLPGTGYSVEIPAGALGAPTSLTLQAVEQTLPSGAGLSFTLAPRTLALAKPAWAVWRYTAQTISGSAPELAGLAYQDNKGSWSGSTKTEVDKGKQTIRARLRSFAHPISWFEQFYMEPVQQTILPNQRVSLTLFYQPGRSENPDDELLVPMVAPVSGDKLLEHLADREIKSWKLNGELTPNDDRRYVAGEVVKTGRGTQATYYAPKSMLLSADNPVAISVDLKLKQKGAITLVSNLTMIDPENEFKVAGRPYKKAFVESIAEKSGNYCKINMWENTSRLGENRAGVGILIHASAFTGTGTYIVREDDKDPAVTMTASDGRDNYVSSWYPPRALNQKHGPISVKITEYGGPGKPIAGQVSATLHSYDRSTDSWKHAEVSAKFRVINNYFQGG